MELRRALLLFAIVLGLAAIAASVSRPARDGEGDRSRPGAAGEGGGAQAPAGAQTGTTPEFHFDAGMAERPTRYLPGGRAATVIVAVDEPGEVELGGLGLTAPADPLTPARFELLASGPGSHPVRFRAYARARPTVVGVLAVGFKVADCRPAAADRELTPEPSSPPASSPRGEADSRSSAPGCERPGERAPPDPPPPSRRRP